MIIADMPPAPYLEAFLQSDRLVASTSISARVAPIVDERIGRAFVAIPTWEPSEVGGRPHEGPTSYSESGKAEILPNPANVILAELAGFRDLAPGWDGETAAKPSSAAISQAVRFARVVGATDEQLEPTLHVDGSVMLELADDSGSLRFEGDAKIIYALSGTGYGVAPFDGFTVPEVLRTVFPV